MRFLLRALMLLLVVGAIGAGIGWYLAGQEPGPVVQIVSPQSFIGQTGTLEFTVETPDGAPSLVSAAIEQGGQSTALNPQAGPAPAGPNLQRLTAPLGKQSQSALAAGPARLVISATRPVFFGLRTATTTVTRDLTVRLEPPRIAVVSLHQFVNLGGAEFVVLRATPDDVTAGVRVGDAEYPAFPGSAVGLPDAALRVAFFALRHDQSIDTPISAFARDPAGSQATTPVEHKPFNRVFVRSKIPIDQRFLDRVVPAIASNTPGLSVDTSSPEALLKSFLSINGDLRQKNAAAIAAFAAKTQPRMLWTEAFQQLGNTQVESRFADQRTYFFGDKEIDRQVHLGFDLASVQQAPVAAANKGVVLFADFLGIYGNCVIIDHGLGVQSLYAHLSQMTLKPGAEVEKGQEIGRTGATGLAGGDHLHFTMLLNGTPVNPVEWWDAHWLQDRVYRKIAEAGGARP
jgi:murein DD-endopeptidase MepM/ murein hydrolase activator NlpD